MVELVFTMGVEVFVMDPAVLQVHPSPILPPNRQAVLLLKSPNSIFQIGIFVWKNVIQGFHFAGGLSSCFPVLLFFYIYLRNHLGYTLNFQASALGIYNTKNKISPIKV